MNKKKKQLKTKIFKPTVQPDGETETGVPIPGDDCVERAKEYGEENEL